MTKRPIWQTREGQKIPIRELGDSHLLNIIAMLRRRAPLAQASALLSVMDGQQMLHGEMALDALEDAERDLTEMGTEEFLRHHSEVYEDLVEEAARRGLALPEVDERRQSDLMTATLLMGIDIAGKGRA